MLQAKQITYALQGKHLIENVTLDFEPGILYGILGPNGSGKSTLLKTLTGIWKPTSGSIVWKGRDLLSQDRREISKTISLVSHYGPIAFDFTVHEVVSMGRYPHEPFLSSRTSHAKVEWALKLVDAWELRDRNVNNLSNGERQRVYIARALVTESEILLLDEPASSLDIRHQLEIWQLLRQLLASGKVIIVANHDLVSTARFCDRVAVMDHGRCIAHGPFPDVVQEKLLHDVFGVIRTAQQGTFALPIA